MNNYLDIGRTRTRQARIREFAEKQARTYIRITPAFVHRRFCDEYASDVDAQPVRYALHNLAAQGVLRRVGAKFYVHETRPGKVHAPGVVNEEQRARAKRRSERRAWHRANTDKLAAVVDGPRRLGLGMDKYPFATMAVGDFFFTEDQMNRCSLTRCARLYAKATGQSFEVYPDGDHMICRRLPDPPSRPINPFD